MKLKEPQLYRFLGLNTTGDLGPFTFYTSKRKGLVFFPKSPPLQPPSILQQRCRNRFSSIALAWSTFNASLKPNWDLACRRRSLRITGYNLWVYYNMSNDSGTIATIERLTGLQLLPT